MGSVRFGSCVRGGGGVTALQTQEAFRPQPTCEPAGCFSPFCLEHPFSPMSSIIVGRCWMGRGQPAQFFFGP